MNRWLALLIALVVVAALGWYGYRLISPEIVVVNASALDIDEVVDFLLTKKPAMTHVCLTGRNAKPELIEAADLVTEMTLIKHPFKEGVKAQKGVEF